MQSRQNTTWIKESWDKVRIEQEDLKLDRQNAQIRQMNEK